MLFSRQTNRTWNFVLLLFLSLFCLAGAIVVLVRDINIDLSKADTATGKVTYAGLKTMKVSGFRFDSYKLIFNFRLENSNQNFAVYHSSALYEKLTSTINTGDTLKVFYRSSTAHYNTHVFQIEKNNKIIEAYKDYNKAISTYTGMAIFTGLVVLIGSVMWFKKISLYRVLTSLVER